MTRIDFYRLGAGGDGTLLQAVCLLAGKAHQSGYRVRVYATEPDRLTDLDVRLWTYRQGSFLPHARAEAADPDFPEPVLLSDCCDGLSGEEVLVCTSPPPADCLEAFHRVAELVPPDPEPREAARRRYALYRDAGHELHVHDLAVN